MLRAEGHEGTLLRPCHGFNRKRRASQGAVDGREVAQACGDYGVVGSQGGFGDGEGAFLQVEGVAGAAQGALGGGEVARRRRPISEGTTRPSGRGPPSSPDAGTVG
jgi:hypothetical protein